MPAASVPVDVEMGDVTLEWSDEKEAVASVLNAVNSEILTIMTAVPVIDLRALSRVQYGTIKRKITGPILKVCINRYLANDASLRGLLTDQLKGVKGESVADIEVEGGDDMKKIMEKFEEKSKVTKDKTAYPEISLFFALLVLDYITKKDSKVDIKVQQSFVSKLVEHLSTETFNRRCCDSFASKIYAYFCRVYSDDVILRNDLLAIYRTATLRQDVQSQAMLLNLILRNYLKYSLYDQASHFVSKTAFPENPRVRNTDMARYLYYIGKMKSVQLEYSEAHNKLMQALRKSPQSATKALGFKVAVWKLALIVELLMGEIPERKNFMVKETAKYLLPYEKLTYAVRSGSLNQFSEVAAKYNAQFKKDGTLTLVNRLHYNVIKVGLRSINVSYSKISLKDICEKLGLESEEDAAGICGKAIVDGVIDAKLDYNTRTLESQGVKDVYSTTVPQEQLHKRIAFCLQLNNDTVKNMEYPQAKKDKVETAEAITNEDIEAILAEADEDDIDML